MKTFNYSYPVNVYFGKGSAKTAFSNELKKEMRIGMGKKKDKKKNKKKYPHQKHGGG